MTNASCTKSDPELEIASVEDIKKREVTILLASPEAALEQHRHLISDLAHEKLIAAIAIDEAHCVLKYGYKRKTKKKRKKPFRPSYGRLLELRAIIGDVPLVALTATASPDVQDQLKKELNMIPCFTLNMSPKKDNIKYTVHRLAREDDLAEYFVWLQNALQQQKEQMKKILLFFHNVRYQTEVHEILDYNLKDDGHIGNPPHSVDTHLFEVYHMKTDDSVKESILEEFSKNGHMRCVLASTSFSMGMDIPDIETVVHFGPAKDMDDFVQECGRAGRREGTKVHAILLYYPGCLNGPLITQAMKDYVKTKSCRRIEVLKHFCNDPKPLAIKHDCCDNCTQMCDCGECPESPLIQLGIVQDQAYLDSVIDSSDMDSSDTESDDSDIDIIRKPVLKLTFDEDIDE